MDIRITEHASYLAALNHLKGVGSQSILRILADFPTVSHLLSASSSGLEQKLGQRLARLLDSQREHWSAIWSATQESLQRSTDRDMIPLPITSDAYPPLLRLIADPPVVLYAQGNMDLLKHSQTIAIVGTRNPTQEGMHVAYRLAQHWARYAYIIVSGLARGIDTAVHKEALDAAGKTIAVLGTPLDNIYLAENKGLAEQIVKDGGLLLSERIAGQPGFKGAFVRSDRIQSGLSLCVFPVQTTRDGGTMHTIHFAREQRRYVMCPRPVIIEEHAIQYEGIWHLIQAEKLPCFHIDQEKHYEKCQKVFQILFHQLLHEPESAESISEAAMQSSALQGQVISLWGIANLKQRPESSRRCSE
jgi:DNA processing protein